MYRTDIQGLRALAVLAVVLYHAGVSFLGGGFVGVDLFFVISGFLITGLLLAEWEKAGRISLAGFWARRARRILPASTLVLVSTAVASIYLLPVLQRPAVSVDMTWAALFSANWRFAQQRTDYLAQDRVDSPVLHYWSLGVEEQFYVVWPLVLVAILLLAVKLGSTTAARQRAMVGGVAAVAVVASFAYEVMETSANQPYAYFGTPARAWQLGLGALLAVAAPALTRIGPRTATATATLGLAGYAWSIANLSETSGTTPYPGWLALVPTVSGALLIAAGCGAGPTLVGRALSIRPLQVIGDLSYSWYLWHFPFLVLGQAKLDQPASPWLVSALVAGSLAASWLTFKYVENPLRHMPRLTMSHPRSLRFGAVLVGVALLAAVVAPSTGETDVETVTGLDGTSITLRPSPASAAGDLISMRGRGCDLDFEETVLPECDFADVDSDKRVVLLGDSHAVMMFPPLERAARDLGWRLTSWSKSGCPVSDVTAYNPPRKRAFDACDEFRSTILDRIIGEKPDLVFIASAASKNQRVYDRASGDLLDPVQSHPQVREGLRRSVKRLTGAGIRVVVMVDPPIAPLNAPSCLAESRRVADCQFRRPPFNGFERPTLKNMNGVRMFDYTRQICQDGLCTPVRGDILIYRDTAHITKTYAMTLMPRIKRLLRSMPAA